MDDRVEVPFDRSIDLGADDFTMMAWIKYGASTGSHAILWAFRTGSGTTPQVWLRAEPESNRIRALLDVDRFNITVQSVGQRVDGVSRFQGTVDEVRVYRRALSTTELDQIRQTNKPIRSQLGLDLPFSSVG
ncbi:hypothetical protein AB0E63_37220 [Kribbella sp. NPDC026596]|uniref:hypothetical protein n=1 Tax=Kribbella sp. NPDC026596 TaxID=3155122 RepID=UPI0033E06F06